VTCPSSAQANFRRLATRAASRDLRGFTLTEVMVVIFMIALLAAVASPSFVKVWRDTSLGRLNMQIAEIYRKAYIESAEQSTYLVRWTGGDAPNIELVKATLDTPFPTLVSPRRCNAIDWTDPAHIRQTLFFNHSAIPQFASVGYVTNTNEEVYTADVCYSQRRAFVRYDNGAFTEMPGAGRVYVKNLQSNMIRRVLIPAFGLPRLIQ
jgi:prepilin-type N-terminal cleavage/methylation domain-containing protein